MFHNPDILTYTLSELTFFEQMLSSHQSSNTCPSDTATSERVLAKGICLLILGIAKKSAEMLLAAVSEFQSILDTNNATIEERLVVQNNVGIAQKAMLLLQGY